VKTSRREAKVTPARKPREAGHIYAQVSLSGVSGQRRVKAMVDTGATLTVVPPRIAEEIGIPRLPMTLKLELADGRQLTAEAGPVILSCRDTQVPARLLLCPGPNHR
jgi:predicted aspartyl protease